MVAIDSNAPPNTNQTKSFKIGGKKSINMNKPDLNKLLFKLFSHLTLFSSKCHVVLMKFS